MILDLEASIDRMLAQPRLRTKILSLNLSDIDLAEDRSSPSLPDSILSTNLSPSGFPFSGRSLFG